MKVTVSAPVTPMDIVPMFGGMVRGMRAESLIDYSQPTRIEPLTLVESVLWREPYMEDVLQTTLNIFAGYYVQAVSLSAEISGISVVRRLDPFNPKRDPTNALADFIGNVVSLESDAYVASAQFGLPSLESVNLWTKAGELGKIDWSVGNPALEAVVIETVAETQARRQAGKGNTGGNTNIDLSSKETLQSLRDNSNLAVGKMVEVTVAVDDKSIKVPVTVRLHTIPVPSKSMTLFLTAGAQNRSLKERWYDMKAEKLRFFADLIGVNDLLDNHRKNIINDPTGLYLKQMQQKRKNMISGVLSGKPSVAQASNIVIISQDQRVTLERELNIKLSTLRGRRVLEQNSGIMILVVIDQGYEQVEIFHRGIEGSTEMSVSHMKNAGKSAGPDIMKVFEMYKSMKAPTF